MWGAYYNVQINLPSIEDGGSLDKTKVSCLRSNQFNIPCFVRGVAGHTGEVERDGTEKGLLWDRDFET